MPQEQRNHFSVPICGSRANSIIIFGPRINTKIPQKHLNDFVVPLLSSKVKGTVAVCRRIGSSLQQKLYDLIMALLRCCNQSALQLLLSLSPVIQYYSYNAQETCITRLTECCDRT